MFVSNIQALTILYNPDYYNIPEFREIVRGLQSYLLYRHIASNKRAEKAECVKKADFFVLPFQGFGWVIESYIFGIAIFCWA